MWRIVLKLVGGVHEVGNLSLCVHDRGVIVAWRQVICAEWHRPIK